MARINFHHLLAIALIIHRRRLRRRLAYKIKQRNKARRFWIRPIFVDRGSAGAFHSLVSRMKETDRESFFRYLRMSPDRFDHLLTLVASLITKSDAVRTPIPPEERFAVTQRFLASGDSQQSTSFQFKMGKSTVCKIMEEVTNKFAVCLRYISFC